MTPTFSDFFKSFYYSNTYLPSVDLGDKGLTKHLLATENQEDAITAQRLISNPEVQTVLSEPLTYDLTEAIPEKNAILQRHGFKLLSSKPDLQTGRIVPFYSVIEHDELQDWVIKSGATRIPKDQLLIGPSNDRNEMAFFTEEESLLRIEMANRVKKIALEANMDVVLPKKKLVVYSNVNGATEPSRKYCIVCEKINILSVKDTVQAIKEMDAEHQREIAKKISTIVQKAGLADASFNNIRLMPDGKLAFIDTEPAGLMVAKKPSLCNKLFNPKGASVEKCARIGLFALMTQATKAGRGTAANPLLDGQSIEAGLEEFHKQVKSDYEKTAAPKLSKWKMTFSVLSLGLIPLVNTIVALVKTKLTKKAYAKLQAMDTAHAERVQKYIREKVPEASNSFGLIPPQKQHEVQRKLEEATRTLAKEDFVIDYQKKRTRITKQFFAYTEGVLYI